MSIRSKYTIIDVANNTGLPVEFLEGMPAKYNGHLDMHDEPRFIGVNRDLPQCDQIYTIAREIGFYHQNRQCHSMVLNHPWKWGMLTIAPDQITQKVRQLDAESRAFCLLMLYSTRDDFRAFVKRHPKTVLVNIFSSNIVDFLLLKVRIKTWFFKFRRIFIFP
jgi:hypothetical protein